MDKFLNNLVTIGGGDARTLAMVPSARAVFQQIAAALLFTASMATVSMWFALHDALRVNAFVAMVFALFWGLGIFVLDRSLMVVGMGGSKAGTIASAVGRLLAAAIIGLVVSTPLTLRIFAPDINAQLGNMQAAQSASNNGAVANSQEQTLVNQLQNSVNDWVSIQSGVLPTDMADSSSSGLVSQLQALKTKEASDQHAADQAAILYNCDVYGGGRDRLDDPSKCAAKPGLNGNAPLYHSEAIAAAQTVTDDQAAIANLQQQLSAANVDKLHALEPQAATQLASLRSQLSAAQQRLVAFQSGLEGDNVGNTGLLAQLTALWKAGAGNAGLMTAHILIALLFMLIEFLPVLAKLMWLFGRAGKAYEAAAASLDDTGLAGADTNRAKAQIVAETEYEAALLAKDADLEQRRITAEHHAELLRINQEAARGVLQARAQQIASRQTALDADFAPLREEELRRRAELEHAAWMAAGRGTQNVTFANFGTGSATDAPNAPSAARGRRFFRVGRGANA